MMRFAPLFVFLASCTGVIGDAGSSEAGDEPDPIGPGGPPGPIVEDTPPECRGDCLGTTQLTRLTRDAYLRSIESAFEREVTIDPALLPADGKVAEHFASNEGAVALEATIAAYNRAAEQLATTLAADVFCMSQDTCGREIFDTYAPRLFRREVDSAWGDAYSELYASTLADEGETVAREVVISTLLQSPYAIYRIEPADESRLPGDALATRLALLLWRDAPDASLREAARRGELDTNEGLRQHAERMLDDVRADASIARFHEEWLGLDGLELPTETADALRAETAAFVTDAFRSESSAIELFTASRAALDATAAEHYGVAPGDDVEIPGRFGLLTHGAVLAAHGGEGLSRPIKRGVFLFNDAICNQVPDPPADVNLAEAMSMAEALGPDASVRDQVEAVTGQGSCATCHRVLNPAGFAFEAFDVDGRFAGGVDTTGSVATAAGEVSFSDHVELVAGLLDNRSLQTCYAIQWFRYALGREETPEDARPLWEIHQSFAESEYSLRELLLQIVVSEPFTRRLAPDPRPADACL